MERFEKVAARWKSETVARHRFGNTPELGKLTDISRRGALIADRIAQTAKSHVEFARRVAGDPTLSEVERSLRLFKFMHKTVADHNSAVDAYLDEVEARSKDLAAKMGEIASPSSHPGKALVEAELRGRAAQMEPAGKLLGEIRRNPDLLRAVAVAPPLLSGIDPDVHKALRREFLESAAPDLMAEVDDLAAAAQAVGQAFKSLHEDAHGLVDFDQAAAMLERKVEA